MLCAGVQPLDTVIQSPKMLCASVQPMHHFFGSDELRVLSWSECVGPEEWLAILSASLHYDADHLEPRPDIPPPEI